MAIFIGFTSLAQGYKYTVSLNNNDKEALFALTRDIETFDRSYGDILIFSSYRNISEMELFLLAQQNGYSLQYFEREKFE